MTDAHSPSAKLVFLNVGGQVFQTTLATLQGGSSMLSKMFSGQMEPGLRDEQGRVYIDRDPKHFGAILNSLRCGGAADAAAKLLPAGRAEQRELLLEAQYYGCEGLVAALEAAEQEWAQCQALELKRLAAAAAVDSSRAAVLQEAEAVEAAAAEVLQQARAEVKAAGVEARQLLAAVEGAAPTAQAEHVPAAYELTSRSSQASQRGQRAAKDLLAARVLRLAALGGGAERAAAALWRREAAMTQYKLETAHKTIDRELRRVLGDEWPPGLADDPLSDEEEEPWGRRNAAAAERAAVQRRLAELERAVGRAQLAPPGPAPAPLAAAAAAAAALRAAGAQFARHRAGANLGAAAPAARQPAAGGQAAAPAGGPQPRAAPANRAGVLGHFGEVPMMVGQPVEAVPWLEDEGDEDWMPALLVDGSDEDD